VVFDSSGDAINDSTLREENSTAAEGNSENQERIEKNLPRGYRLLQTIDDQHQDFGANQQKPVGKKNQNKAKDNCKSVVNDVFF
jgi:hypothetical protein